MASKKTIRYQDAGVSIDEADRAVRPSASMARRTFTRAVLTDIGSFGGGYLLKGYEEPGAGELGRRRRHQAQAGVPDRTARHGRRRPGQSLRERHRGAGRRAAVLPGLFRGRKAGCEGRGGRWFGNGARLPRQRLRADRRRNGGDARACTRPANTIWPGFIVGAVERKRDADRQAIRPGDVLLGLPSNGLHTNGYSLARKLLFEVAGPRPDTLLPEAGATSPTS